MSKSQKHPPKKKSGKRIFSLWKASNYTPSDTKALTLLFTDASNLYGQSFALIQKQDNSDKLSLIMCGSKALTDTQAKYATKELPDFEVQMDHRPLQGVFQC